MKTVILCGGTGTRMKEETEFKPKPLVLVGGKPILWHIMKIYSHYGFNEFILALGYKGHMIKEHFLHWRTLSNDFTLDTKNHRLMFHNNDCDDFIITFAETGEDSLTGERVRRLKPYIGNDDFMVTYGDGVGDIDIAKLVDFHKRQDTVGTITAVKPGTRFGFLDLNHEENKIKDFWQHKITSDEERGTKDYINGGFMVFKNEVLDMIQENSMIEEVFVPLSHEGQLSFYLHNGGWKCMDTHKEMEDLNKLWHNKPFWKVW